MDIMNLSVKQKLISIAVLIIVAIVGMLALQTYSTSSILSLEKDIQLTNDIQIGMLNLRRAEKDFLARQDMKYVGKFDKHHSKMQEHVNKLDTALQHAGIDNATLTASKAALDTYAQTFHQLVQVQKKIGLNPKDGLYGSLRKAVHNAETQIKELKDHQLMADTLMLRRREKDFMLREDAKYIGKFNKDFAKLETHLAERSLPDEVRTALAGAMQAYQQDFIKLFEGYKEKGLDSKSGLRGNMRAAVHDAEENLKNMESQITEAIEHQLTKLNIISWSSLIVMALIFLIARSIIVPITALSHLMDEASRDKNLTMRSDLSGTDEISTMAGAFNDMMASFHDILNRVSQTSDQVNAASEHLATITQQTSEGVRRQHSESDQVSTAMNEMSATVQEVSKQAQDAANASGSADKKASEGKQIVQENSNGIHQLATQIESTSSAIYQLSDESKNIGGVLQVIRDIAEQTNLLALNAAIEAARAGEQGRGFAVVADEVRNLAQRSQKSTEEIQDIVERLQQKANDAVTAMGSGQEEAKNSVERAEQVGLSLDSILSEISAISSMNTQIASAAEEQASVAEEINRSIVEIAQISNETSEGASETTSTSNDLARLSQELHGMIVQFKL